MRQDEGRKGVPPSMTQQTEEGGRLRTQGCCIGEGGGQPTSPSIRLGGLSVQEAASAAKRRTDAVWLWVGQYGTGRWTPRAVAAQTTTKERTDREATMRQQAFVEAFSIED
jgi:hypothetical protein